MLGGGGVGIGEGEEGFVQTLFSYRSNGRSGAVSLLFCLWLVDREGEARMDSLVRREGGRENKVRIQENGGTITATSSAWKHLYKDETSSFLCVLIARCESGGEERGRGKNRGTMATIATRAGVPSAP